MKINHRMHVFLLLVLALLLTSRSLWAEEDGLGTNVVRNLRVNNGGTMTLGGQFITNWASVASTSSVSLGDFITYTNAVQGATNALNSSVTNVSYQETNILYGATNALNSATGALDTAVSALNARTNDWNNGVVIKTGGGVLAANSLYCMTNGSTAWTAACASTNTTAQGLIGLALGIDSSSGLLLNGQRTITGHGFTNGAPIYLSTVASNMTSTRPAGTNQIVRIVGYAIDNNTIMFNPDRTYIEILGE